MRIPKIRFRYKQVNGLVRPESLTYQLEELKDTKEGCDIFDYVEWVEDYIEWLEENLES